MRIRQAHTGELDTILGLREEAVAWLASRGSDQWNRPWPTYTAMVERLRAAIVAGEVWVAEQDKQVLGTITVNESTDPGLWTQDEQRTALFVHRMIVSRAAAGQQVGAMLLDFAEHMAQASEREWLRLDAWTSNSDLHEYYKRQGFRHVRTVASHDTPSAACFERAVGVGQSDYRRAYTVIRPGA